MLSPLNLQSFIRELTGRPQSLLTEDLKQQHEALAENIQGKRVLVIGGAGTIGSSFVKAVSRFQPGSLMVVDINENGLTELVRDLRSTAGLKLPEDFRFYPMNLGDRAFHKLFSQSPSFDIVANFAAHKHVRSEKDRFSIEAMIDNNVIRAKHFLDLLSQAAPKRFFCVSTDKATKPVNIMGASKSLMEQIIMAYSKVFPVTTARFANVAFSNGSLLDGFLYRLTKNQPISAPLDVKRYFVSPEESGQICMLSCLLANTAEICFPKLDYSKDLLTFAEIAERFLHALGLEPDYCSDEEQARQKARERSSNSTSYPVYFFKSDTSGEKPVEEFYSIDESVDWNRFQSLAVIRYAGQHSPQEANKIVRELELFFENPNLDKAAIVAKLSEFLPDFAHDERGKNLDQKM
jgi:FlaA1/EpsC-like NDP-sugar epimerase